MGQRGDAYHSPITITDNSMKMKTIKLADGTEHSVPVEVADALDTKADAEATLKTKADAEKGTLLLDADTLKVLNQGGVLDAKGKVPPAFLKKMKGKKGEEGEEEEEDEGDDKTKDAISALRAKLDTLEARGTADAESFNARVDTRSRLVASAVGILGANTKTDGVSDSALMSSVVVGVTPGMAARLKDHVKDESYLRCAYDSALELHATRGAAIQDAGRVIYDALQSDSDEDIFIDALTAYSKRAES